MGVSDLRWVCQILGVCVESQMGVSDLRCVWSEMSGCGQSQASESIFRWDLSYYVHVL